MSSKEDNRDVNLNSVFGGLNRIFNIVADMAATGETERNIQGSINPDADKGVTGQYGFNIKMGGGDSFDKAFNSIFDAGSSHPLKTVAPVCDLFEEEDGATVVMELPGVKKEDIRLRIEGNSVTVTADKKDIRYTKTLALHFAPRADSVRENFCNYIYSAEFEKAEEL